MSLLQCQLRITDRAQKKVVHFLGNCVILHFWITVLSIPINFVHCILLCFQGQKLKSKYVMNKHRHGKWLWNLGKNKAEYTATQSLFILGVLKWERNEILNRNELSFSKGTCTIVKLIKWYFCNFSNLYQSWSLFPMNWWYGCLISLRELFHSNIYTFLRGSHLKK